MRIDREEILEYNAELKEGLSEMYNMLPPGQKKQVLKNEKVRACLVRFGIIENGELRNERTGFERL